LRCRVATGELSVTEPAAPFEMSQPAVSKHLRVLERAGLIEQGRQAQWRPRRLQAGPLREVADWGSQYRRHWEESFERLDTYLREVEEQQEQGNGEHDDSDADRQGEHPDNDHLLGGRGARLRAHLRRTARAGLAGIHRPRDRPALVGSPWHD